MSKHVKKGESFKLFCQHCGKPAFIDPSTIQVMEDIDKLYAVICCTDKSCGHKQILDGTFPKKQGNIISP